MGVQVVSGGETVELDGRLWSFDPATMAPYSASAFVGADLVDPRAVWRTQRSVRTVVGFLARNIAQVALHGFTRESDGDRKRVAADTPLGRLLRRPSAATTPYEALHGVVVDMCLWERHASWITERDGRPELVRLPPQMWKFERDGLSAPTAIVAKLDEGAELKRIPLSQLFWLDGYPIPDASPLGTLTTLLEEEAESGRYRRDLWRRGARFGNLFERPLEAPQWSSKAKEEFRDSIQQFVADGSRAGQTPVLEDGMKFVELNGITPEAAQQLEARKFSINEVASAFFVPGVFVGVMEGNSSYNSVTGYREILYSDTLGPWFQQLGQAFNARVLPHPLVAAGSDDFAEFNVAEKLRMSFDEQAKIFQKAAGAPFMTRNEVRRVMNLRQLPGADGLVMPLNTDDGNDDDPKESE